MPWRADVCLIDVYRARLKIMSSGNKLCQVKTLKEEFEPKGVGMKIGCDACLNEYEIKVVKEGEAYSDFGIICCVFCGQQIKLY